MKVGDRVRLKSGGALMTIIDTNSKTKSIKCEWFDNTQNVKTDWFSEVILMNEEI